MIHHHIHQHFKKAFAIILLSVIFSACDMDEDISPSGLITSVEKSFANFSAVEVQNGFDVIFTFDSTEKVVIEANENIHSYIDARQSGSRLIFKTADNYDFSSNTQVKIYISAKQITELKGSGAADFSSTNAFKTDALTAYLSGGSSITAMVDCSVVSADVSGASKMNLSGRANRYSFNASGASHSSGFEFTVNEFDCDLSGASDVDITVEKNLRVKASGGSTVNYKGNGSVISQELSGGSEINKR